MRCQPTVAAGLYSYAYTIQAFQSRTPYHAMRSTSLVRFSSTSGGSYNDDSAPIALVTGVSRSIGIGHAVAKRLQDDGYRVVAAGWKAYDERMPWGADEATANEDDPIASSQYFAVDFEDPLATQDLIPAVVQDTGGPLSVLVLCHCESVDSDILTTTVESFDKHMAVNARSTWQLIRSFALQYNAEQASTSSKDERRELQKGALPNVLRILSITSDHTAGNLPYGASKGAMDRIVLAAAHELAGIGCTCNVINPGAVDTGWMSPDIVQQVLQHNLQPRLGQPSDVANLISFLCSPEGQWINGQILYSDGGLRSQ